MLLKSTLTTLLLLLIINVDQWRTTVAYKTEIEITPAPPEETTTKKSGFFGGIKKLFGGSSRTTTVSPLVEVTTAKISTQSLPENRDVPSPPVSNRKPPPLVISNAPLVPLGPRPETPLSSPFGVGPPQWPQPSGSSGASNTVRDPSSVSRPSSPTQGVQPSPIATATSSTFKDPSNPIGKPSSPPQWPQPQSQPHPQPVRETSSISSTSTTTIKPLYQQNIHDVHTNSGRPGSVGKPNFPPGFEPYNPQKSHPSGVDLSYGGGLTRPQHGGRPSPGLAPLTTPATTTSTSTPTSTTTTTTAQPKQLDIDLRGDFGMKKPTSPLSTKDDFPALPAPRKPSVGGVKEDFPALPAPKLPSPTPSSPISPSSPSAWNKPIPIPNAGPVSPVVNITPRLPTHKTGPDSYSGGMSSVPYTATTTTTRPGLGKQENSLATDDEILSLTETLFSKEVHSHLSSITINAQGKTRSIDSTDEAPQPLLDVDPKVFENPTIAKMRLLFNNYEKDTMVNEYVTPMERKEENDFLDAVMATNVMRQAMIFLQNKGIVSADPKTHRDLVKELWFTQYSRGNGKIGSSGFEHVFVNEVKDGTIIGLHNWVYFFDEEKAGHLDYKGYLNQLDLGMKAKILKIRFTHNGLNKPVNTLFVGTSPELELALYTVCFKLRPDRTCPVSLGNSKFGIVTYSWRYRGKSLIGSAYPEI